MGRLAKFSSYDNESPRRIVRPTAAPPPPPIQQDNNAYVVNETYEEFDTKQSTGSTSTRTFSEAEERRMSGDSIQTLVNEVFDSSDDDYTEPKSVFSEGNQNES